MNRFFTLLVLAAFSNVQVNAQCNPDTEPPVVVAMNGLSLNIFPTQMASLWATDLLSGTQDNCTPEHLIQLGIRKAGDGTGFPVNPDGSPQIVITYVCCDQLGVHIVELWARDAAGNTSVDSNYIFLQDNMGLCDCFNATIAGCAYTPSEKIVTDVSWKMTGNHPALPPAEISQVKDCMEFGGIPFLGDYAVIPGKNQDPLNGVSTFDLVKINKHILGLEALANPYQIIAADANNSRSISTFDILELRKLILGIYTELPNNRSWRFVPKGYPFPNPANPFAEIFPEQIALLSLQSSLEHIDFTGIKIGDINGNIVSDSLKSDSDERTVLHLSMSDALLRPGQSLRIPVQIKTDQHLLGMQFALEFDPELIEISGLSLSEHLNSSQPLAAPDAYFFQTTPGQLRFSWSAPQPTALAAGDVVFFLEIKTKQALQISQVLRLQPDCLRPELYPNDGGIRPLNLEFSAQPAPRHSEVFPAVPNPSSAAVNIPVALAEPANLRLELFDGKGRLVYSAEQQGVVGFQNLNIPAAALVGKGQVLLYRVIWGEQVFSGKLLRTE